MRAKAGFRPAWLAVELALAACDPGSGRNVVELHCRGERVLDAEPSTRPVTSSYRINVHTSALEVWNPDTVQFVRWGTGRLAVGPTAITYAGEVRVTDRGIWVSRHLRFDRASGKIRDRVEGSWGGVTQFNGTCEEG